MRKFNKTVFLACGLLLTLAAFPVFAQDIQENKINKKPLQDFFKHVLQKVIAEKVDLTKPFAIELEGVLTKEGRLDPKSAKFTKSEGDEKAVNVAKTFVEAVNDSGWFIYLQSYGIEKIKLALVQDDSQIYADVVLELPTLERARTITSGFSMLLRMIPLMNEKSEKKLSEDGKVLFQGVKVKNEDKNVTLKFAYQKSVVHEMINRKLQDIETEIKLSE